MTMLLLRSQFLGFGDPTVHAARQPDFLADLARGIRTETCDLPVVENAKIIELLLDRRRHVSELLEIIRNPARSGQHLVARTFCGGGWLLADRFGGRTSIHPKL